MSLIADALRAAERQQPKRSGANPDHAFLDGFFPQGVSTRSLVPRRVVAVAGGVVLVAALTGLSVMKLRAPAPSVRVPRAQRHEPIAPRVAASLPNASKPDSAARESHAIAAKANPPARNAVRSAAAPAPERAPVRTVGTAPADPGSSTPTDAAPSASTAALPPAPAAPASAAPAVQVTVDAGALRPVDAIMTQALAAQRQGDLGAAKQLYDRAIKVGPVSAALYNNYGALLHDMGDSPSAVAMLRLALSLDQTFVSAWVNLGNAEDALGDRGAATSAYEQALKLDPANRDARVGLAWQYVYISAFADARRLLDEMLRASPDFAPAHYALGQALEGLGDTAGAAREFGRFLDLGGAAGKPRLAADVRAHIGALMQK